MEGRDYFSPWAAAVAFERRAHAIKVRASRERCPAAPAEGLIYFFTTMQERSATLDQVRVESG